MLNNKNKGFSLLELIVTIGIMAVLAGILIPSMVTASNDSRKKTDEAAMQHLAEVYKSAAQEHQAYYYFSRAVELLEDGEKEVYVWYEVKNDPTDPDSKGEVQYVGMNLKYPEGASADTIYAINDWGSKFKDEITDYVNGTYEIPKMESKDSYGKSYVIAITATEREYLVNVRGKWED